jgi:predicted protein tyrosine phosphatase
VTRSPEQATYDRVTDLVWLGSRINSVREYVRLRALGIRACIDMKQEGADPWGFEAFLWLPTADHEPPSPAQLRMGLAFLRECETSAMPVLVTCMGGVGRSSTLVLAHLLSGRFREEGPDVALQFLSARRAMVSPSPEQIEAACLAAVVPAS